MNTTRRALLGATASAPLVWDVAFRPAFAQTPRDTVVMAKTIDDIISLDPGESFEFSGNEVCGNVYERLISPDPVAPTKINGQLAQGWEMAQDGKSITFHLDPAKKFASGAPVTAEDVQFSMTRAVVMDKSPAFILNQFGFTKDNAAQTIQAPDPHTVVLSFSEAQAPSFLLYCLSANVGGVVEKKVVLSRAQGDDFGNGWLKTNSAGSGPFVLRGWRASEQVSLDRNPNHPAGSNSKRLIILHRPDRSAQLLALQKGDVDIARNLSPEALKQLASDPGYSLVKEGKATVGYLAMNQNVPNLAKPEVRQAIKWAIDYKAIEANITPGIYDAHQAFLPKGVPAALEDLPFQKDVDKGKGLLKEAGLPDGFEVTLDHYAATPYSDIAQALQADLGAIGIKVSLLAGEQRQVITKTRARQHQLAYLEWGSDYFDPNSNAETFCENPDNSDATKNRTVCWRSSWQDKELTDRALANAREQDSAKRIAVYGELQRLHRARSPFAFVLQQVEIAAMRKDVSGVSLGALSDQTTYDKISKA